LHRASEMRLAAPRSFCGAHEPSPRFAALMLNLPALTTGSGQRKNYVSRIGRQELGA
jgi:hypothetical protein